jgi:DNA-binding ferritin-like protein (Dps family)
MDMEKLFNDAEKRNEYDRENQRIEKLVKDNFPDYGTDDSSVLKKGIFIRALCKKLRELIPDGEVISLVDEENGCIEVDGLDIAVFLLTLTKDIPENEHMWDPRPCNDDPDFIDEHDLTSLRQHMIKLPEGW